MHKLDRLDLRLIRELDSNSRQSVRKIGRTLKAAPETIRYRLQALLQHKVIQNFLTVIDGGRLGFYYYKVLLRLQNVNEPMLQKVITELAERKDIDWVVRLDGSYDIAFTIAVSNSNEMSDFMDDFRARHSERIADWNLSINIKMFFFTRDYLTGQERKPARLASYSAHTEAYEMTERDRRILQFLADDSRISAEDIAQRIGIGADTVLSRIKQFERDGVISRYTLVLDNGAMGQLNYYVLIHLSRLSKERRAEFEKFCQLQPNIVYLIKALGEWDYEMSVECADMQIFRNLMMSLTSKFSDIVRNYQAMTVSKIYKYVYP